MRRVLALVDESPMAAVVATSASTVARLTSLELDVLTLVERGDRLVREITSLDAPGTAIPVRTAPGPIGRALADELADVSVAGIVLGARSMDGKPDGLGHIARLIATTSSRPLVLLPPHAGPLVGDHLRFLLPLDGTRSTTESAIRTVDALVAPMGTVVPFHVFGPATVPMMMSSDEDRAVIADEFAARHTASITADTEAMCLGLGNPADEIISVVERAHIDAVILNWDQHLESGRAEVVRRLITHGRTAIILDPVEGVLD